MNECPKGTIEHDLTDLELAIRELKSCIIEEFSKLWDRIFYIIKKGIE